MLDTISGMPAGQPPNCLIMQAISVWNDPCGSSSMMATARLAVEIDAKRDESVFIQRGEGDVRTTRAVAEDPAICVSVCAEY